MIERNRQPARPRRAERRAFTLLEATLVVVIIFVLIGLAAVAAGRALRAAQRAGERQFINSIGMGVEQFRNDHGFLPPLVVDREPVSLTSPVGPNIPPLGVGDDPAEYRAFLEYRRSTSLGRRWSYLSLPYYLAGALDMEVDGLALDGAPGPALTKVGRDGRFERRGKPFGPYIGIDRDARRLRRVKSDSSDPAADRPEIMALVDRWGIKQDPDLQALGNGNSPYRNAIRYYRWLPEFERSGPRKGHVKEYHTPAFLGSTSGPGGIELRSASYAIVSIGPDGLINDNAGPEDPANQDNIVEIGK